MRILSRGRAPGAAGKVELLVSILYGTGLFALGLYALSTPAGLGLVGLGEGELGDTVRAVLSAVWLAVLLCSLLPVVFIELAYAGMPVAGSVELRRIHMSAASGATVGLAATYLFAANYVASTFEVRRDLSYFKVTEPSESTLRMVRGLNEPVEVVLFFPEANEVLEQVRPYFDTLARQSRSLRVRVTDQVLEPALAREHRVRGNGNVLVLRGEQGETFEVGSDFENARSRLRRLDGTFQRTFISVTRPDRIVYLTVGHGERGGEARAAAEGEGIRDFETVLRELGMERRSLGPGQGLGNEVPEDATAVAVIGPTRELLAEEAASLARYVERGGRLFLLLEPDTEAGLGPVLGALGLRLERGRVEHERHHMQRTFTNADRSIIFSNGYSSHPTVTTVSRNASNVATIMLGAGHLSEIREKGRRVSVTLRSMPESWADLDGDNEFDDGPEKKATLSLAAAVTIPAEGRQEGRAFVIADADVVSDQVLLRAPGNLYLVADVLRWLVGDEDAVGELSSEEDVPIEHTRDEDVLWFYGTVVLVPAIVVAAGLVVSLGRRRPKRGRSSS